MNLQVGNSRLLALLFLLLSYITICWSIPTKAVATEPSSDYDKYIFPRSSLAKRNDYGGFLEDLSKATRVQQGEEEFLPFGSSEAILASDGFIGCIGILIAGNKGAILGHYTNTDTDIRQAESNLPTLIKDNKDALAGAKAYLYAQVRPLSPQIYVSEDNNKKLEAIVKDHLGITAERVKYIEPEDLMLGEDGDIDEDACPEEFLYGSMMVKHPGGGSNGWEVIFIDFDWQKSAAGGSS